MKSQIAIIDYQIGNIFSLQSAFEKAGVDVVLTMDKDIISNAQAIVLPGVGQYLEASRNLQDEGLTELLCQLAKDGRPILGICLGMQLLMTDSEEGEGYPGLNIITGSCRRLTECDEGVPLFKIPQIGWNKLLAPNGVSVEKSWAGTILEGIGDDDHAYFLHSFIVEPEDSNNIAAKTKYGWDDFCSVIQDGNIWGCQFHPERSGAIGQRILDNFVSAYCS
jgi:glutamine amidotransferase